MAPKKSRVFFHLGFWYNDRDTRLRGHRAVDPLLESLGFLPGEYELRTKGQQAIDFLSAIDPVQGIHRGMAASGRAFDDSLPPEVRRQAAIEAALETAAPVGMMGIGSLAKQPAKAALLDMLTLTGAPSSMDRVPGSVPRVDNQAPIDPSRRKFLGGVASLPVAAAIAPDMITDVMQRAGKVASRVPTNALDGVLANVKLTKQTMDELMALKDDVQFGEPEEFRNLPSNNRLMIKTTEDNIKKKNDIDDAVRSIDQDWRYSDMERVDYAREALEMLMDDPDLAKGATDETLEGLIDEFDQDYMLRELMEDPEFELLVNEAKARGLHTRKTEDGFSAFPAIESVVKDYFQD